MNKMLFHNYSNVLRKYTTSLNRDGIQVAFINKEK